MDAKPPKNDPPHWLQVGDENWGPTDMRKHKGRPIHKPPLPSVWFGGDESRSDWSIFAVLAWLAVLVLLGALIYWLRQ
jgi:hypothetical protein